MENKEIHSVVIIGAGNLAWHLGHQLVKAGVPILQVVNRSAVQGKLLATELNAFFTTKPELLNRDADLYILAVSDDAIGGIVEKVKFEPKQLVVHTAGSIDMNIFDGRAENYGVFYPLQTFTKGKPVDFSQIPLFIEANTPVNLEKINQLAKKFSDRVYSVDSEKRMYLHLAAVIASNFTNHMFAITEMVLQERDLSFDLLKPLIQETIDKALLLSPFKAQTGPAVRGNSKVIDKHLSLLEHHPGIQELYRVITESIEEVTRDKGRGTSK